MKVKALIGIVLMCLITVSNVYALPRSVERANEELGFNYFKESSKPSCLPLNEELANGKWNGMAGLSGIGTDQVFVYGNPSDFNSSVNRHRYLGKTVAEDDFTNMFYPHDAWGGGYLEDRKWTEEPWYKPETDDMAQDVTFDAPNVGDKYLEQIKAGMKMYYSSKLKGTYVNKDWHNYVHVLQPPTSSSWGMGRMWHHSGGTIWYITIPIVPGNKLAFNYKAEIIDYPDEAPAGSSIVVEARADCLNGLGESAEGTTTAAWYVNGTLVDYDDNFNINQSKTWQKALTMTVSQGDEMEVKFVVNYNKDKPSEEYHPGFADNESIVKIKAAAPNPGSGNIVFEPNSCEWRNRDLDVRAYIKENRVITKQARDTRRYRYTDSEGNTIIGSTYWTFYQDWTAQQINVWGDSFITRKRPINSNGTGSVTLNTDGIGILHGEVRAWVPGARVWRAGSPPRGSWIPGGPNRDTPSPTETYYSESGTYHIDKTQPTINFNFNNSDGQVIYGGETIYEYVFEKNSNNDIEVIIGDNLSGAVQSRYMWSRSENFPDTAIMLDMGTTTDEGKSDTTSKVLYPHDTANRINEWNLHVYTRDRAGNEQRATVRINFKSILHDLGITDIKDPNWKVVFRNTDGSPKNVHYPVGLMPVDENPYLKNAAVKKGYAFYFSLKSRGLNLNSDKITVTPSFFWTEGIGSSQRQEVDLYYHIDDKYYIKSGSGQDTLKITQNDIEIGSLSRLTLDLEQRSVNNTVEAEWLGKYFIPYSAIPVKAGMTVTDKRNRLQGGYIIVQFEIKAYRLDENNNSMLVFSYTESDRYGRPDMYTVEKGGYTPSVKPLSPGRCEVGDIILFDNSHSALEDYKSGVDR